MEAPLTMPGSVAAPSRSRKDPRNRRLTILLLVLLLLLGFLLYLYWLLTKPPTPAEPVKVPGITPLFSIYGYGKSRLNNPDGVAFGPDGKIYISDTGNHRGLVFTNGGRFLFEFGKRKVKVGIEKKKLFYPLGIAVNPKNGDIYVASMIASRISVFSSTGKFKREMVMDRPIRVKIYKNRLYVTTPGAIWKTTLKGKILQRWGSKGRQIRQFEYPNGIDFDKKGNIFVSDTENNRLQILNPKGEVIGGRGTPTTSLNQQNRTFGLGVGLALDEQQRVYIADAFHHALRVFDYDGNDYGELGQQGGNDGEFNYPSDIAYRGNGVFAVADKWNDRIQVVQVTPPSKPVKKLNTPSKKPKASK